MASAKAMDATITYDPKHLAHLEWPMAVLSFATTATEGAEHHQCIIVVFPMI